MSPDDFQDAEVLGGGLMNEVFRVWKGSSSYILKRAPPHVAKAPHIPMSPHRLRYESWALERGFAAFGVLSPALVDEGEDWVLLQDFGPLPTLDQALLRGRTVDLVGLGAFVRELHGRAGPDNAQVQRTRLDVQYRPLGLAAFGERLCQPGDHLVHGDLWPRSVLVGDGFLGLIDWEFCHHGRACQDLGHLLAHLWMLDQVHGVGADQALAFLEGYGDDGQDRDTLTHMAAEVLVRAAGPFVQGYLYDGVDASEAIRFARGLLSDARSP